MLIPRSQQLTLLPGSPHQSVLVPLDYAPSRDYRPRWGYSQKPHAGLMALMAPLHDHYRQILSDLSGMCDWLTEIPREFSHDTAPEPGWIGGPITALDCGLLYYFVHHFRPKVYLEIGSGVTTCFARRAATDHAIGTRIISIDPAPRANIEAICDEVHRDGLETADLAAFDKLEPGDIVFIDGSHRSFMNSDVTVLMLDVLPILKPGVIVHFHDIFLPYDYPQMFHDWYWNEQYLLGAYLLGARDRISVLMPSHYVTTSPDIMESLPQAPVDLGTESASWFHGGSFWFTHL